MPSYSAETTKLFRLACVLLLFALQEPYSVGAAEERGTTDVDTDQTVEKEAKAKYEASLQEFSRKYNADLTWKDMVHGGDVSTFRLQKALIRSDKRPVLAEVSLLDIEKRGSDFVLLFYVPSLAASTFPGQYLMFELTCPLSESQLNTMKVENRVFLQFREPQYLVAAKISRTERSKMNFELVSSSHLRKVHTEYIAKGRCVGLQSIVNPAGEDRSKLR
jgi:hypothetical protein